MLCWECHSVCVWKQNLTSDVQQVAGLLCFIVSNCPGFRVIVVIAGFTRSKADGELRYFQWLQIDQSFIPLLSLGDVMSHEKLLPTVYHLDVGKSVADHANALFGGP